MSFTVEDFHRLVRLWAQHPEWRAELRRLVLSEELLTLPQLFRELGEKVRELAEAQRRHYEEFAAHRQEFLAYRAEADRRFAELAEAQRRTEQQLQELAAEVRALAEGQRQLAEAQRRTEEQVQELTVEVRALAQAQRRLEQRVGKLEDRVGDLVGSDLERRYREQAHAFFSRILKRIGRLAPETLQQLLEDAIAAGRIREEEGQEVLLADVIVSGRRDGEQAYLVVEVSAKIRVSDVDGAVRRAERLQRATQMPVLAAVAGQRLEPKAEDRARALGVWRVLDGVVFPP